MPNDENMDVENIDEELIENESSQEEQDGQEERHKKILIMQLNRE